MASLNCHKSKCPFHQLITISGMIFAFIFHSNKQQQDTLKLVFILIIFNTPMLLMAYIQKAGNHQW